MLGIGVAAALTYFGKMGGWSFVTGLAVCNVGYYMPDVILRLRERR